ncbi:hypothetical protein ILYODFUR_031887, partial [Ilyodon furcidens]
MVISEPEPRHCMRQRKAGQKLNLRAWPRWYKSLRSTREIQGEWHRIRRRVRQPATSHSRRRWKPQMDSAGGADRVRSSWRGTSENHGLPAGFSPGHPLPNPGHNCALLDTAGQFSWQSSSCTKKLGYICYKGGTLPAPPRIEEGFCSNPWVPYNGHCFHLQRNAKSWPDAQRECRKEGGDLINIQNVEDQSFVISQLGY